MAQPAAVLPPVVATHRREAGESAFRFEGLLLEYASIGRRRSATLFASVAAHAVLIVLIMLIPLLTYDALPAPGEAARAFFATPADVAPPPPPPAPPAPGVRAAPKALAPAPVEEAKFVAPIDVPDAIKPEDAGLDFGVAGGVPGGVEGGVPGGVAGGIVGGLPLEPPPTPAPSVVRIGGMIKAPRLIKTVPPVYPTLAAQARLSAIVIVEALVDLSGHVKSVTVLRGAPLFDEPAMEAVKQWRYQPLLLNGMPTEFILTVTVKFNISRPEESR